MCAGSSTGRASHGALSLPHSLEEHDARRDGDVEAVRRAVASGSRRARPRPPARRRETPWRSLPTTRATGPVRSARHSGDAPSGVATTTRDPCSPQPGSARSPSTARPAGGRACRPSRERRRDGRRRCVVSQTRSPVAPAEQAERTIVPRLPGRSIPSATRTSGSAPSARLRASSANARRPRGARPGGATSRSSGRLRPDLDDARAGRAPPARTSSSSASPRKSSGAA